MPRVRKRREKAKKAASSRRGFNTGSRSGTLGFDLDSEWRTNTGW